MPEPNYTANELSTGVMLQAFEQKAVTSPAPAGALGWPEPEALGDDLPPVAELEAEMLPESLRAMVEDVAERMHVPLDLPGVTTVAMLAGVVGRRASIQPQRHDTSWVVIPNLWGGIVAPPSSMKSGVINAIAAPFRAIESEWAAEQSEQDKNYEAESEDFKLKKQAWERLATKAYETGKEPPPKPLELEPKRSPRRLITQDATRESLHVMNKANPAGLFVLLDELTGWLVGLEENGRKQERTYFLTGWNGDQPFTMDRVGRGSIRVERTCLSMFGGIQPSPLRHYLANTLRSGGGADGLAQRFQLIAWPDPLKSKWTNVDRAPNRAAQERATAIFRRLAHMDALEPRLYRFSAQAQALFVEWRTELERRLKTQEDGETITAHLSKYRSLMPSLALLFWLADDGSQEEVPVRYAQLAADWCNYLESHARRVFSSQCSPEQESARCLARRILSGALGECFTLRDTYRKGWSGLTTAKQGKAAVLYLQDLSWLRPIAAESRPGRPSVMFLVNPLLEAHHESN